MPSGLELPPFEGASFLTFTTASTGTVSTFGLISTIGAGAFSFLFLIPSSAAEGVGSSVIHF